MSLCTTNLSIKYFSQFIRISYLGRIKMSIHLGFDSTVVWFSCNTLEVHTRAKRQSEYIPKITYIPPIVISNMRDDHYSPLIRCEETNRHQLHSLGAHWSLKHIHHDEMRFGAHRCKLLTRVIRHRIYFGASELRYESCKHTTTYLTKQYSEMTAYHSHRILHSPKSFTKARSIRRDRTDV